LELTAWTDRVFGEADPSDFQPDRLVGICEPDSASFLKLAEIFENPVRFLNRYDDGALGQAFWDLGFATFVGVYQESIEWELRHRLIRSFETLFRDLFAARCSPVLGHLSETDDPLSVACYMWWDFDCWSAMPDPLTRNPYDSAFLASMKAILAIDHVACQESALHGLGHWQRAHKSVVEAIIDSFLQGTPEIREELREYAYDARRGHVL
jgi:hypothetical protein